MTDAFFTVDQKVATLVTACDSMNNKTEYSPGKVLPGLRAGSRLWYESFATLLKEKLNLQQCDSYPSLLKDPSNLCFLLLHVDDMMVVGDASYIDSKLLPVLNASYKVSCSFIRNVGDEVVFLNQLVKLAGIKPSNVCKKIPGHPLIDDFDTTKELNTTECSAHHTSFEYRRVQTHSKNEGHSTSFGELFAWDKRAVPQSPVQRWLVHQVFITLMVAVNCPLLVELCLLFVKRLTWKFSVMLAGLRKSKTDAVLVQLAFWLQRVFYILHHVRKS